MEGVLYFRHPNDRVNTPWRCSRSKPTIIKALPKLARAAIYVWT